MFTATLVPGSTQGAAALIGTNSNPLKVLALYSVAAHEKTVFKGWDRNKSC